MCTCQILSTYIIKNKINILSYYSLTLFLRLFRLFIHPPSTNPHLTPNSVPGLPATSYPMSANSNNTNYP